MAVYLIWPNFICEACTVRSVLQRKLTGPHDWKLLCFERMRLLDMAHYWAIGMVKTYSSKLQVLRSFEHHFDGLHIFRPTSLLHSPRGPEIPLMWCQEAYSLRPGSSRRQSAMDKVHLTFSTVWALRFALGQYYAWDMMVSQPHSVYQDERKRILGGHC